jgi:hypothetical protein
MDKEGIKITISELTIKELLDIKANLPAYRKWYAEEGRWYFMSLDRVSSEPQLSENEMLNFLYLKAAYSLNTFHGCHIKPEGYFETGTEKICAAIIGWGGTIVDMRKAGADALYCALLSDPHTDKATLLKTVDQHIPF